MPSALSLSTIRKPARCRAREQKFSRMEIAVMTISVEKADSRHVEKTETDYCR
jgi:hypothetical protein